MICYLQGGDPDKPVIQLQYEYKVLGVKGASGINLSPRTMSQLGRETEIGQILPSYPFHSSQALLMDWTMLPPTPIYSDIIPFFREVQCGVTFYLKTMTSQATD